MWSSEHKVEASVAPEAIWRLWSDVAGWAAWNSDIESIELTGPFAAGSQISMTPAGQEPVKLRLVEVVENECFVDEADLGDAVVRTVHRINRLNEGRVQIVYRMEISGPAADELGPQLGPEISSDFPETLTALVELARA